AGAIDPPPYDQPGVVAWYAAGAWTTFTVNVVGCAAIGVLMVLITDVWAAHRLVRPFLGTGVLGGFTTFSTYAVDIQKLIDDGHPGIGLGYLAATLLAALSAVWLAVTATRRALARRQR
ncbi:CrcB family protein, partial [Streptomyces sp. NPDC005534]|uniref:fluoride efflux transporter FluC n=1 Tax=Streptomyces sp. NPDC005534 TaxID=3155714 RepID=UPI00345249E9